MSKLKHNFMRGRQMIVHDPRLNNPLTKPASPLKPPAAYNVWTVSTAHRTDDIFSWAGQVGKGVGKLDALHIMCHGAPGYLELGTPGLSWNNLTAVRGVGNFTRFIVIFACSVGAGTRTDYELNMGNAIAFHANCEVLMCYATQYYSWSKGSVIDFGQFEGSVYRFRNNQSTSVYNIWGTKYLDLEGIIF